MNPQAQTPPDLLTAMDRAGYDILSQNQPQIIEEIKTAFSLGATAKNIEDRMVERYGLYNLKAALVVCAAYYIEKNGVTSEPTNLTTI